MNFFEHQDVARRSTTRLILLFAAAVLALVALTNVLVFLLFRYSFFFADFAGQAEYNAQTFELVSVAVLLVIGLASAFRIASLRSGGQAVAESMGGVLLVDAGDHLGRRQLLNVVEEMAIASGTPVPPVYIIPGDAINAFAAGYGPADAVIGVTEGAIAELNRDQLQGVIAHEFSHILNGDMRLNIHLMGVLFGILVVATVGRLLAHGSGRGGSSRRSGGSSATAALVLAGVGLMLVGYTGKFFGSLIKAGVSRQREYLADASAVQFTRNPDGIAGALKRIGGFTEGSEVKLSGSDEISHMFFADGVGGSWLQLMATHPPLNDRIQRLDSRWDGQFLQQRSPESSSQGDALAAGFAADLSAGVAMASEASSVDINSVLASVGQLPETGLDEASAALAGVPESLLRAVHEPFSARAVMYLLLLHPDPEIRDKQSRHIHQHGDAGVYDALLGLLPLTESAQQHRMLLMEVAVGTLRQLSQQQYQGFKSNLGAMISADGRINLQEWMVKTYLTSILDAAILGKRPRGKVLHLDRVKPELRMILSLLAYADSSSTLPPEQCFGKGAELVDVTEGLLPRDEVRFRPLEQALFRLVQVHPLRKPQLLKACMNVIAADNRITINERETVRVFAAVLDCPVPVIHST